MKTKAIIVSMFLFLSLTSFLCYLFLGKTFSKSSKGDNHQFETDDGVRSLQVSKTNVSTATNIRTTEFEFLARKYLRTSANQLNTDDEAVDDQSPNVRSEKLSEKELAEIQRNEKKLEIVAERFDNEAPRILFDLVAKEEPDEETGANIFESVSETLTNEAFKGTNVEKVRCGQSICEIYLVHNCEKSRELYQTAKIDPGPWAARDFHEELTNRADGTIVSHIYFSKERNNAGFEKIKQQIVSSID